MDGGSTSLTGWWTTVLNPQVWHYGHLHLVFLEPELIIFEQEGGIRDNTRYYQ